MTLQCFDMHFYLENKKKGGGWRGHIKNPKKRKIMSLEIAGSSSLSATGDLEIEKEKENEDNKGSASSVVDLEIEKEKEKEDIKGSASVVDLEIEKEKEDIKGSASVVDLEIEKEKEDNKGSASPKPPSRKRSLASLLLSSPRSPDREAYYQDPIASKCQTKKIWKAIPARGNPTPHSQASPKGKTKHFFFWDWSLLWCFRV